MNLNKIFFFILISVLLSNCNKNNSEAEWLIPSDEIFDGGPGKDGIPSVDNPQFVDLSEIDYLNDEDLIIGLKVGDEIRGYPHPILDWHEIINDDDFKGETISMTYCPLTGTGIAWNRMIPNGPTEFGVSGLLYNTNLIPYDRKTDSNWSQMKLECVNGQLKGTKIETFHAVETTWKSWKNMFPSSKIVSTNTGFNRSYGDYPYINFSGQDYRIENNFLLFPVNPRDERLPLKERVLGVILEEKVRAYRFESFTNGEIDIIHDQINNRPIVVAGSQTYNWMVAFESVLADGTQLTFSPLQDQGDKIMIDNEGNSWNLWGEAVEGQRIGSKLTKTTSFIGYWVAWGAFYPGLEIYE